MKLKILVMLVFLKFLVEAAIYSSIIYVCIEAYHNEKTNLWHEIALTSYNCEQPSIGKMLGMTLEDQ